MKIGAPVMANRDLATAFLFPLLRDISFEFSRID